MKFKTVLIFFITLLSLNCFAGQKGLKKLYSESEKRYKVDIKGLFYTDNRPFIEIHASKPTVFKVPLDGVFYTLKHQNLTSSSSRDFNFSEGVATYVGKIPLNFFVIGTASVSVTDSAKVRFTFFINDKPVSGGKGTVAVSCASGELEPMAIATIIRLKPEDKIYVRAQVHTGSSEGTTLTLENGNIIIGK
jgi:hypothetical protein